MTGRFCSVTAYLVNNGNPSLICVFQIGRNSKMGLDSNGTREPLTVLRYYCVYDACCLTKKNNNATSTDAILRSYHILRRPMRRCVLINYYAICNPPLGVILIFNKNSVLRRQLNSKYPFPNFQVRDFFRGSGFCPASVGDSFQNRNRAVTTLQRDIRFLSSWVPHFDAVRPSGLGYTSLRSAAAAMRATRRVTLPRFIT